MADPRAAHLCYGLASLDDETLQFFLDHPAAITRLYEHAAAAFAAAGSSLHVRQNRVVVSGGEAAADVWAAAVGERPESPEPFVRALFEQDEGRLAYLYDAIGELDAPRAAFALGLWIKDPATRIKRFKALVDVNRTAIPQWQPARLPFTRPLYDIASILARVQVEPDGSPSVPSLRSAWAWIFESAELPAGGPRARSAALDDGPIDAAWLAQMIVSLDTRDRGERIDQLAFGQRVFGHADAADNASVLIAIRAFPRFRMLLLTLERSGVRHPAVYVSAARRAQQLSSLDSRRLFVALGQFQSALALIARMASVHTLDVAATEALITSLASVSPNNDGRYGGAIATWMQQKLRPALVVRLKPDAAGDPTAPAKPDLDLEEVVLQAVAGVSRTRGRTRRARVEWEGDVYRVDIAASEERRLRRIREKQGGLSLDEALAQGKEDALAGVLMAWTYAVSIADADSPVLLTGDRHAPPRFRARSRRARAAAPDGVGIAPAGHRRRRAVARHRFAARAGRRAVGAVAAARRRRPRDRRADALVQRARRVCRRGGAAEPLRPARPRPRRDRRGRGAGRRARGGARGGPRTRRRGRRRDPDGRVAAACAEMDSGARTGSSRLVLFDDRAAVSRPGADRRSQCVGHVRAGLVGMLLHAPGVAEPVAVAGRAGPSWA